MSGAVMAVMAVATVASTYVNMENGKKAQSAQAQANEQAKQASDKALADSKAQANLQEQEMNRANAKTPNLSAMMDATKKATSVGGGSATLLSGPNGVKTSDLSLGGGSTLLGS